MSYEKHYRWKVRFAAWKTEESLGDKTSGQCSAQSKAYYCHITNGVIKTKDRHHGCCIF